MKSTITDFPIRMGCYVEFTKITNGEIQDIKGYVTDERWHDRGYHLFTVKTPCGRSTIKISGRKLYTGLTHHEPGDTSRIERRRCIKKSRRHRKQRKRAMKRGSWGRKFARNQRIGGIL